jgi:hypothetical protein
MHLGRRLGEPKIWTAYCGAYISAVACSRPTTFFHSNVSQKFHCCLWIDRLQVDLPKIIGGFPPFFFSKVPKKALVPHNTVGSSTGLIHSE